MGGVLFRSMRFSGTGHVAGEAPISSGLSAGQFAAAARTSPPRLSGWVVAVCSPMSGSVAQVAARIC